MIDFLPDALQMSSRITRAASGRHFPDFRSPLQIVRNGMVVAKFCGDDGSLDASIAPPAKNI